MLERWNDMQILQKGGSYKVMLIKPTNRRERLSTTERGIQKSHHSGCRLTDSMTHKKVGEPLDSSIEANSCLLVGVWCQLLRSYLRAEKVFV